MTPKEKAKELVEGFAETIPHKTFGVLMERDWATAKQCALMAVDEILASADFELLGKISKGHPMQGYWQQVKEEINKL